MRNYYMQFEENQTQSMIDTKIMEFEARSRNAFQAQVRQAVFTLRSMWPCTAGLYMLHLPCAPHHGVETAPGASCERAVLLM